MGPPPRPARKAARSRKRKVKASDLFFGLIGTGILTHETAIAEESEPALLFVSLFLYGLIPISRADPGGLSFRDVAVLLLGGQLPGKPPDEDPPA